MTPETTISLIGLAFTASLTPGPNNSMLASSGATYGIRATLPHIMGVVFGFPVMIFLVSLGLGEVVANNELVQDVLRWAGALTLIWVAWKTATARAPRGLGNKTKPMTFLQASAFQWVNPKGWAFAIAITTQFITGDDALQIAAFVAFLFVLSGLCAAFAWAAFGKSAARWLGTRMRLRAFNWTMAGFIVVFLIILMMDGLDNV